MKREYDFNIRITFEKPLVVKFQLESDTQEIQRQTERLDAAGKELDASVAATTPQQIQTKT